MSQRIDIETLVIGQMGVNCYIVCDKTSRDAIIIDPGDEASFIAEHVEGLNAHPTHIFATHGHFDHVLAARELQLIYSVPFCMHSADQFLLNRMSETAEHFLGHTIVEQPPVINHDFLTVNRVPIGSSSIQVIKAPGHTPGSMFFYLQKEHVVFVGDTIFANGGVGRTDFSYANGGDLHKSLKFLFTLPSDTRVCTGHGEDTTIALERQFHR